MKIVINSDFGGYGLSKAAYAELGIRWDGYGYAYNEDRSNASLVACVEKLGSLASGPYSSLAVIEIPDDIDWQIQDYDGAEWVAEKHRTWPQTGGLAVADEVGCPSPEPLIITRARAALAQPEPVGPSDEELIRVYQAAYQPAWERGEHFGCHIDGLRAVLVRLGRPTIEPVPDAKARELLNLLLDDLDALIDSSEGVAGLHLNGDIASWESLREGGRFETWLMRMDEARAFLDSIMDKPDYDRLTIAAALRAVADQVVPANGSRRNNEIRAELLAIAAELEGTQSLSGTH